MWKVETFKGIKFIGTLFGGSVASQQMTVEVYAHLGHAGSAVVLLGSGYFNAGNQVLFSIGAQLADGQLAPCKNHWFCQVFQHIAQCRCGVCHGVCAVKYHKPVIHVVVVGNNVRYVCP